jgi:nucleoid-associated protein YgaU
LLITPLDLNSNYVIIHLCKEEDRIMAVQKSIVDRFAEFFKTRSSTPTTSSAAGTLNQKGAAILPRTTARKIIATHMIRDTDTLSGIALKYYGSAVRDYWMVIYDFNRAVIGDDPGVIHPGTELMIPELPGALPMKRKG